MAKYYVSATRKSPTGAIIALKVHPVNSADKFNDVNSIEMPHDEVARSILAGHTYETIVLTKSSPREWRLGANTEVILRTDRNASTQDNLDNLPDF